MTDSFDLRSGSKPLFRFSTRTLAGLCLLSALPGFGQSPSIISQPVDQIIFYGDLCTFSVAASGNGPISYQWYRDGSVILGASSASYSLGRVNSNHNGASFFVQVSNSQGAITSSPAKLNVDFGTLGTPETNRVVWMTNSWKFNVSAVDLETGWKVTAFNDSGWASGAALLYAADASRTSNITGGPLATHLPLAPGALPTTCYFRTHFNNPFPTSAAVDAYISTVVDDGVVVHLNGEEAYRLGIAARPVFYSDLASRSVNDAALEGPAIFDGLTNLVTGDNVLGAEVHQVNSGSSDIVWGTTLDLVGTPRFRDTTPPTLVRTIPDPGSTVPALTQIEIHFSEAVLGVRKEDLLVNGTAATNVTAYAPDIYVFDFPQPASGLIQASWSPNLAITDFSANSNRFSGAGFNYMLDPTLINRAVRLNEFMAGNNHTIRDEDGNYSDWIEIYNAGTEPVNLGGWFLTDNPLWPNKWRFPSGVSILSQGYMLVWASGLDRTNPAAPLHTNFKLDKAAGNSISLMFSDGASVVSSFSSYPQQYNDVSYGRDKFAPSIVGYFTNATPRAANATVGPGFGPEVRFSVMGCTFQQPLSVTLSSDEPAAVIRYLLVTNAISAMVGMIPDNSSPVYTGPIAVSGTTQIRARAYSTKTGYFPGPVRNETYIQLASAVAGFNSDLPIVVFHNMGAGAIAATEDQFMTMQVFDTHGGRSSLLNPPDVSTQGYFHRRGQATFWLPKANLRVETQDPYGENLSVPLLGMPAENDWVFYGINSYDKVLMHNTLTHDLYRDMGHYTSRTRYVEVYVKDDSGTPGALSAADYNGLYVLEEKIKIDKNRVDIDKLQPENITTPTVTGGYLLSIDKSNPGWPSYVADAAIWHLDPDFFEINSPERSAQYNYIISYFDAFYNALYGANWKDQTTGYAAYIDMSSWIDYHLHQTFVFNVDALRISSYFQKPRNGRIIQGPLWDFDRAFGTRTGDDGRGFNPRRWRSGDGDGGTDMFNWSGTFYNPWYGRLFTDVDFWQKWIDRYQELRCSTYHVTNLMAKIDGIADEIREATTREYARWSDTKPRVGTVTGDGSSYTFPVPGTWQGEVDFVKWWFSNRLDFMDGNFLNPPVFSAAGGTVTPGSVLTITASTREAGSTVYYTLDGTDPRLPGGAVSPKAYSGAGSVSLTIGTNIGVFARNYNSSHKNLTGANNPPLSSSWSGSTAATFVVSLPPLRITELMYHPLPPPPGNTNDNDAFEYIEFQNISQTAINLQGYRLAGGVDFSFSNYTVAAGQTILLVRNLAAFQSRYPGVTTIAGVYTNNLENNGEHLVLSGPLGEPILDFNYNDSWYPSTDGLGFALQIRDPLGPVAAWDVPEGWRPSAGLGGSPGLIDPPPPTLPQILVTEALTHTDPPQVDTVELRNPTSLPADLTGWFLTDDRHDPKKYRIPSGSSIPPGGYLSFTTNQFGLGARGFSLSSIGDSIYLFSGDASTNLTGYSHGFSFGAAPNGVSFGRHLDSQGGEHFVLQSANTLGTNNAYPRVGPIVVSEFMYHPPATFANTRDNYREYIELVNITQTNVPLYSPSAPSNTWRIRNAVDYDFPGDVTLPPGGRILVVPFDPVKYPSAAAGFVAAYGIPGSVPLFGPWQGKLDNRGNAIELQCPDNPNVTPTNVVVPYYLVEKISYRTQAPWPMSADGAGDCLHRVNKTLFANEPTNWAGLAPFFDQPRVPVITAQPKSETVVVGQDAAFQATVTGSEPLRCQWYLNITNVLGGATNSSLTVANSQVADSGNYQVIVTNDYGSCTSRVAQLLVVASPVITSQPRDQLAVRGGAALFDIVAEGTMPLSYKWYYNTNTPLPGDGNSLLLLNVNPMQSGVYQCVVSNAWGTATSRPARLTVAEAPVIDLQPVDTTVALGGTASFAVVASGAEPLAYQWYFNGVSPLAGGTNALITLNQVQLTAAGGYQAVITNAFGSVTSAVAQLKILIPPTIDPGSLRLTATNRTLAMRSLTGTHYVLEYKRALMDPQWISIDPAILGNDSIIELQDTNAPFAGNRFYRVRSY